MSASVLIRKQPAPDTSRVAETRQTILKDLECVELYPMLSETTIWAMAMVNNPNVSLAEIANLIRRDAVIATAVLQRANNWAYSGRAIESIQQAVLRVGLQECGKLLCMMGTQNMYNKHPLIVQQRCDEVHRHSLFVAQLACELNRTTGFGFNGVEFTAGLLHDIGRVILYVKCPPEATDNAPLSAAGEDILSVERARFGIDHCAIGEMFARKNGLPEQVVSVIANHHRPGGDSADARLVALVALANRLANYAQWEHNVTGYDLQACPAFRTISQRWNAERIETFTRALPGVVVRAIRATRTMLKSFA